MEYTEEELSRRSLGPGAISEIATNRLKAALAKFLETLAGPFDSDQADSIKDTPQRFVKALVEVTEGYELDPAVILSRSFKQKFDEMVVVTDIDFTSTCEHHLLPFIGKAAIAYIPRDNVVGLSKIPRLVDCYAKRLQLQERMATEIADALEKHLDPLGVGVILEAQHQCMSCRGVKKQNAKMITSVLRGRFKDVPEARAEFLKFMR